MATNQKPRVTFKRRNKYTESYNIIVDGAMLTRSSDGNESWLTFSSDGDNRPYNCTCFVFINEELTCIQIPATPHVIADTLKALRPLIQQAVINARLQAAEKATEEKSE